MWKNEILASKFPFPPNSEEDANYILFKDSPERFILLKWIYILMCGLNYNISPNDLAEYFLDMGIIEGDPIKFIQGNCPKEVQIKIWKNLLRFAGMMKCTPEICELFSSKHCHEMSAAYTMVNKAPSKADTEEPSPLEPDETDWDTIISNLQDNLSKIAEASVTEENHNVLDRLKDYLEKFMPINSRLILDEAKIEQQKELGDSITRLYTTLQTLERVLTLNNTINPTLRELERSLDDHTLRSESALRMAKILKEINLDKKE